MSNKSARQAVLRSAPLRHVPGTNDEPLDGDSLHSLLSDGRFSGAQRERVLDGALNRAMGRRRWYRVALASAVVLPAAAVLALLLRTPELPAPESAPEFEARGGGAPVLRALCPERPFGECRIGDRLIFEIEGASGPGFFAAYAQCASGERIWYFPAADGSLPEIVPNPGRSVVDRAARIGAEHTGSCTLRLFALKQKETRAALVAGAQHFEHTDLTLEVEP